MWIKSPPVDRRSVLRSIGVGAFGTGIAPGVAQAASDDSTVADLTIDLNEVLQLDEVQSVLSAVGHPQLSTEKASGSAITFASEPPMKMVHLPSEHGEISIGYQENEQAEVTITLNADAHSVFNGSDNPETLDVEWPVGTDALVTNTNDGALFVREPSENERTHLARLLNYSPENVTALWNSERQAFLTTLDEDASTTQPQSPQRTVSRDVSVPEIRSDKQWVDLATGEVADYHDASWGPQPTAQYSKSYCLYSFAACAADLAFPSACKYCSIPCKASKLTGWVGFTACFICISHICGVEAFKYFSDCGTTLECIDQYVVDVPFVG